MGQKMGQKIRQKMGQKMGQKQVPEELAINEFESGAPTGPMAAAGPAT
jgi:hypothetical protein